MEGYSPIPMFSVGLLIGKRPFQDGAMPGKNCPFQGTLPTSSEGPLFFKQDERSLLPRYEVLGTRYPTAGDPLH